MKINSNVGRGNEVSGMEPTWESECGSIALYHADCRDVLPNTGPDCIITDPVWPNVPEGMFALSESPADLFASAVATIPLTVRRMAVQLGCNSDPRILGSIDGRFPFFRVCWLEYVRPGYIGRLLYTSDVAYLFGTPPESRRGNMVISGLCRLVNSKRTETEHPCPRQPFHVEWLVDKWSTEGETICDPFMGSGTTGQACAKLGRRFIGIECNREFFDEAQRRIQDALNSQPLFKEQLTEKQENLFQ